MVQGFEIAFCLSAAREMHTEPTALIQFGRSENERDQATEAPGEFIKRFMKNYEKLYEKIN